MHCLLLLTPHHYLSPLLPIHSIPKTLTFHFPKLLFQSSSSSSSSLASSQTPPHSTSPLEEEDEDEEEDDEEEDEAEDTDDDVAAEDFVFAASAGEEDEEEEDDEELVSEEVDSSRRFEETKSQRIGRLVGLVREFGEEMIDYNELAGIYDFPVDKFQRLAIQAFLRGSSVVVSAPTSSGKTLIAEAAAVATAARGRRLFYTTPLKALSNQKFRDFRTAFGEHNVGLLTGDTAINKDAQIVIMTTEILRNMLYQSVGMASSESRLFQVDVIVLDEVHYLSDISRGTVWEEIVIYCPKEVQLICLSATVANPDELAGWIGQIHGKTELVTSTKRPVPLIWQFSRKSSLLPLLDSKGRKINRKLSVDYLKLASLRSESNDEKGRQKQRRMAKLEQGFSPPVSISRQGLLSKNELSTLRRSQVPQIRETLTQLREKDMLPAIWFIFSRRGCDAAVQYLEDCQLLNNCEAGEVELELRRFRMQYPDAVREVALKGLLQGVAAHHAGCLPLWKSFVEELFQRGLIKVVFATETLAAGMNMPARTAVISSLIKRVEAGRTMLSPNELFQMAGRAGRRGIDTVGHAVLIQTPYEGPEECFEILFAGLEPLVSQFTASFGMVLNLLAGSKLTHNLKEPEIVKTKQSGRTLEEARKLVEQSFGNYVGSNVMVAAKEELKKIEQEIDYLSSEITDESVDRKCQEQLSEREYLEISALQNNLRAEKRLLAELRRKMELERMAAWKPLLNECESGNLSIMCLQYKDKDAVQHTVPVVFIGKLSSFSDDKVMKMVDGDLLCPEKLESDSGVAEHCDPTYYVALSSDNSWYLFTEKWIRTVYKSGLPAVSIAESDPRETLKQLLLKEEVQWEKLADSEFGSILCMEGSLETWSWSLNVPVRSSLSEDDEVNYLSQEYQYVAECYKDQRKKVSHLKKAIKNSEGFKEFKKIVDVRNFSKERIERLMVRSRRLARRIEQIEPTGWKEFQQISKVIHEARALDVNTHVIYPLGETAAAIRGENELWLAMVLRNKVLLDLKPAQLAAVCGSLVSEGIKLRPWKTGSYIYDPSRVVTNVINHLEEQRDSLTSLQEKYGVQIPCELDGQFSGMVEAWASGLTWREIMMDSAMDEGDLARLLRRTIDLLAQIPKLPDIDPVLQRTAQLTANVMDRAPISELAG